MTLRSPRAPANRSMPKLRSVTIVPGTASGFARSCAGRLRNGRAVSGDEVNS